MNLYIIPSIEIENFVFTTAAHLLNPEKTFRVAGGAGWGVEVYPIPPRFWTISINAAANITHLPIHIPHTVDVCNIKEWEEKYKAKTQRIHLSWWYSVPEITHEILVGNILKRPPKLKTAILMAGAAYLLGTNSNEHGINLAKNLDVGVSAHPNVLEGMKRDCRLSDLKNKVPFILGENTNNFKSIILEDAKTMSDPSIVASKIETHYQIDGLLLGVDHLFDEDVRLNPGDHPLLERVNRVIQWFDDPDILRQTRAIHLSSLNHAPLIIGDKPTELLIRSLLEKDWQTPISITLDYATGSFARVTPAKQSDYLKRFEEWVRNLNTGK